MAYTTGYATTTAQLLDGIQTGAVSGGWTLVHRGPDTGGGTLTGYRADILWLTNGTQYLGFSFNAAVVPTHELQCYGATGFNNTLAYTAQPGYYSLYSHWVWIPCRRWHVFSLPEYVYVVVEGTVDSFRHFGGGVLVKQDNYVGGAFLHSHRSYSTSSHEQPFKYFANYNSTYAARVAGDGYTERWRVNSANFPDGIRGGIQHDDSLTDILLSGQAVQFNRQAILVPIYTSVIRVSGPFSPIGYPPNIRAVGINFLNPSGEVITLGPDSWHVFPIGEVGAADARSNPSGRGLAYKVV